MDDVQTALKPAELPGVVRDIVALFATRGIALRDIGNGWCDEFADEVLDRWVGKDWRVKDGMGPDFHNFETGQFVVRDDDEMATDWDWALLAKHWNITPPAGVSASVLTEVAIREPVHVWITTGQRHYDAENPDGVDSFLDLAFFRRWIEAMQEAEDKG